TTFRVSVFPPQLKQRALQYSTARTQVLLDSQASSLGSARANIAPLVSEANVVAHLAASPALLARIGLNAHIPGGEIYATGPIEANLTRFVQEPSQVKRAFEVTGETNPYRLQFDQDTVVPTISIYSQAPTNSQAVALANGAASAISQYVESVAVGSHTTPAERVTVRQLGAPTAGVGDSGIVPSLGGLVFLAVLAVWCVLVLLAVRFAGVWRESAQLAILRAAVAEHHTGGLQPAETEPSEGADEHEFSRYGGTHDVSESDRVLPELNPGSARV
ncbi:MAG: hypothetical protein J2P17_26075, partial [Mycobacterium sp.]|nr:hypothetical protein [Mycobacterium sp.]